MKQLKNGFTLIELMIVVAIIGILSAIAIPGFLRYVKRSKTSEAFTNLQAMYNGMVTYYETEHTTRGVGDSALPKQFPVQGSPTGMGGPCPGMRMKFVPTDTGPATWLAGETAKALAFSLSDPFYYSYGYLSAASGAPTMATAIANGDLDCDGRFSIFERAATVDSNLQVRGSSAIYSLNELE